MMRRMDEGFDVVYGRRRARAEREPLQAGHGVDCSTACSAPSREVEIPSDTGDFRLMSRRVVERLNAMPEQDRFLRGMVAWLGGRQSEIVYDREGRATPARPATRWPRCCGWRWTG